jgi:hypothetical protein
MRFIARAFIGFLVLLGAAAAPAGALEAGAVCQICTVEAQPGVTTPSSAAIHFLDTTFTIRTGELRETDRFQGAIALDLAARTFELALDEDLIYEGHLSPKGKSGRKFTGFFDEHSHQEFMELIADRGEKLAAVFSLDALGDVTTIALQLDDEGVPSLKLKSRVLMTGPSEFVVKLKLEPGEGQ